MIVTTIQTEPVIQISLTVAETKKLRSIMRWDASIPDLCEGPNRNNDEWKALHKFMVDMASKLGSILK